MNILPKKSWHVRSKDNITRVRKDEAAAREEERKKQEKLEFAESEARVNYLRKRSGLPEKQIEENAEEKREAEDACSSHVNLFPDYKSHVKTSNKELEKEQKEEQEKYEKKIGYLTYLGQDTNEALRLKSWYEVAPKRFAADTEIEKINEKESKSKHNNDPLTLINALLARDTKTNNKSLSLKRERSRSPQLADRPKPTKGKKEHKRHKNEKNRKHQKKANKRRKLKDEKDQKRSKLAELRKIRLLRETAERARQEALLAPKESNKKNEERGGFIPKIVQKYNSQFNPELAKQNTN